MLKIDTQFHLNEGNNDSNEDVEMSKSEENKSQTCQEETSGHHNNRILFTNRPNTRKKGCLNFLFVYFSAHQEGLLCLDYS